MPKIKKSWIIIGAIVLTIAVWFGVSAWIKKPSDGYITEKISAGQVLQEVSETGSVKAAESVSLGFKAGGKIAGINVSAGDSIKNGQILASLDSNQLSAQLRNAEAVLREAQKQYDKLVNGLTPEDIKTYEDAVALAKHDLQAEYKGALNVLDDAYVKIYNAHTTITSVYNSYFNVQDQMGIRVSENRTIVKENLDSVKTYLDKAKAGSEADIDSAAARGLQALDSVYDSLKIVRDQCEDPIYYSKVSSTDKTSLDTQKGYINTARTNLTSSQQDIASDKIALQKAEDNLALKSATPRAEDVDIYKADVAQAEANVELYQSQLNDNYLRSPIDGMITKVNIKRGETASANEAVVNLLSSAPFEIKVDIYEQDIVNVKSGDNAKITLVAFPKQTFEGKVVSIDPAEKIVDNVVYYEVTVDFPQQPEGIKSGMTADIVIETNKKENVLRAPKNAVVTIDGKDMVQIIKDGKVQDRAISLGLEGNDYVEVLSGLDEGQQIIIGKK